MHVSCLARTIIYPYKGIDGCIPFTLSFKPSKKVFFHFDQILKLEVFKWIQCFKVWCKPKHIYFLMVDLICAC
jgi:hypothetical protein